MEGFQGYKLLYLEMHNHSNIVWANAFKYLNCVKVEERECGDQTA